MAKPKITQKGEIPGDLSLPKPVPIPIEEKETTEEDTK
jgi:hypothetical protein